MLGLGYLGLGEIETAALFFNETSRMDINHQGCQIHKLMADQLSNSNS